MVEQFDITFHHCLVYSFPIYHTFKHKNCIIIFSEEKQFSYNVMTLKFRTVIKEVIKRIICQLSLSCMQTI